MKPGSESSRPTGVDPSLQQGTLPSPEEATRIIDEFWQDDPTENWKPYLDATRDSLAAGNAVTMISGAHGSGKTMLYARDLQYGETGAYVLEAHVSEDITDAYFEQLSQAVLCVDEVTDSPTHYADFIQRGIAHSKQFVAITPGPNAEARKKMVDDNTEALAEHDIEVNYLGDVHGVHVTPERSAELLTALGVDQEVIKLFNDISALRSPRFFARLIDTHYYYPAEPTQMTAASIKELMTKFIEGTNDARTTGYIDGMASEIITNHGIGSPIRPHALFMSNNLSTADCIQMYEALGVALPVQSDFPNQEMFEYSYHKD